MTKPSFSFTLENENIDFGWWQQPNTFKKIESVCEYY